MKYVVVVMVVATYIITVAIVVFGSGSTDEKRAEMVQKLNRNNCKLAEVIAPNSMFADTQYKYECTNLNYTLNVDLSKDLSNK
ncbi:MAG: hypothetical protein L0G48_08145 [Staphylococcus equorum]|nr:hypothetical protein [Acinetobacter sp.]MDN5638102.1 hypothetical protein [Staphylococcus equorum]